MRAVRFTVFAAAALAAMTLPAAADPVSIGTAMVAWIAGTTEAAVAASTLLSVAATVATVAVAAAESIGLPYIAPALHWSDSKQ